MEDIQDSPGPSAQAFGEALGELGGTQDLGGSQPDLGAQDDDDDDGWEDEGVETITYAIRDILDARAQYVTTLPTCCSLPHTFYSVSERVRKDRRTWTQRVKSLDENWNKKLPLLVDAYLNHKYGTTPPAADPESTATIEILDLYSCKSTATIPIADGQSLAEALVTAGYLPTTPLLPSLAISLKTLELYRCIRLYKASFSAEAFTKLLCHQYCIPYRRSYRTSISDAFDIYTLILEKIHDRVMAALQRDTPDWRAQHSCPACSYEVEGEEPPLYSRMVCIDGNNSLKRLATSEGRNTGDTRSFDSDYILPREFVDQFANEVKARQRQPKPDLLDSDDEIEENTRVPGDTGGDPTDGCNTTSKAAPCATNWKAAAADEKKRMWGAFDESGVFICVCRHGLILWIADMIRSGELAKYALAMASRVNAKIPGKKMIGYDIGCAFEETVLHSILRAAFEESGSRFCVPAFHGYSHSYNCQVQYHPNAIEGVGLEDFEESERVFNRSNELAIITHHASRFRRHLAINMFFRQWDHERYASIGEMLYNNFVQASDIIGSAHGLDQSLQSLELTDADLTRFETEEREYFATLQDEDPANVHTIAYVEALQALQKAQNELADTSRRFRGRAPRIDGEVQLTFLAPNSGPVSYDTNRSETLKLERRRRQLLDRVDHLTAEVIAIETEYGIENRWQPGDFLYQQTVEYISTRRFQRALGRLQRLVIQRLFELHKLNIGRAGYKVRTYLAKSLQRRCRAIRNAVAEYNAAARALKPARPEVDFDKVTHYTFLEQFTLLQDTRNDIRDKPWTRPEVRETIKLSRRIRRAREEVSSVNREARRVHTSIRDEEILFRSVLTQLKDEGNVLHGAVEEYCRHRRAANARNMMYLQKLYALPGFTGIPSAGRHPGAQPSPEAERRGEEGAADSGDTDAAEVEGFEVDEGTHEVAYAIWEYLADLR
ncbi:hypothetical protein K466DRAFT_505734 [Polyporus arcularius HHB13444]|uniref:CxC1-like cysteine cluster associated with KDZ transposases domain-containing protein n=1 Tax=Polyporus arcularius HHB13444 TaxID=1314778 RepID=A0A5C3NRD9_9APHY|nr:hypothetical protein K466DRAFT_505734 [Polyporus arcularius HHB13444]